VGAAREEGSGGEGHSCRRGRRQYDETKRGCAASQPGVGSESAEPATATAGSACSKRGQSPHRSRRRRGHRLRRAPCLVLVESLLSADKILSMAGAYEREAIRPHVLGRFADMLTAVEGHPAMLVYLDNLESMGPNSVAGINRDKSLNENLAREILELHTLGVRTGYSQDDVTHFANVLTGWTWIGLGEPNRGGEFVFVKRLHEPGEQTVIGKSYPDTGVDQGRAVLADLARHPATARHVAHKFARYFVADNPPPSLVDKLAKNFNDSDGNLKELAKALITAEESWTPERTKLKRPSEWLISGLRLTGAQRVVGRVMSGQALLGEPLWRPPAPNGFADD